MLAGRTKLQTLSVLMSSRTRSTIPGKQSVAVASTLGSARKLARSMIVAKATVAGAKHLLMGMGGESFFLQYKKDSQHLWG